MLTLDWLKNLRLNEINLITTYRAEPLDYPMKNTGRVHCGFLYTLEGEETYVFEDKSITASPNTVLFIPKDEKYTIKFSGEKSVVISFDFEVDDYQNTRPFLAKYSANPPLRSYFLEAEHLWLKKPPEFYTLCMANFYRIVASLIRHENHYCNTETYSKIAIAVSHLHSHYLEPDFKIEHLSRIVKMSPRYFEMLFALQFKMTPKKYVIHLKLELAKELLRSEKNTVSSVAAQLGFNDVYHFSRTFKAKTGYTPTQYKHNDT